MRLAVFGGGKGAVPHLRALNEVPDVELVAIAEVNPDRRRELEEAYAVTGYESYETLLDAVRPDAVLVALPHHLHAPAVLASIASGAHVLVEKPMTLSVEACDRMIEAARRVGLTLMVGQTHHFYPNVMEAHRIVQSGALGEVLMATDTLYSPYFGNRPAWFFDVNAAGGGGWMANGIHLVDRTCWILGELPDVRLWQTYYRLGESEFSRLIRFITQTVYGAGLARNFEYWPAYLETEAVWREEAALVFRRQQSPKEALQRMATRMQAILDAALAWE